ncbi:MAG: LON peptidase substrate-binding domain-containing protein [Anaerolineae bacterium]|nr:LON peptidase substrate-binding domain-containing protein [Anaerolineae bacterium]
MSDLYKLPLFPLETVLFPGMVLPLHIFEPRYRLMIGRCVAENKPFGVTLIREGREVGGPATPFDVGTTAYVTHYERLDDGRMNIQAVGYQRFRIHNLLQEKPYLEAMVEDFPIEGIDQPGVDTLVAQLRPMLSEYLAVLASASDVEETFNEIPDDGMALAYFLSILVPFPMKDKQKILEASDLQAMLAIGQELLKREMVLLDHMIRLGYPNQDTSTFFSPN